MHARWSAKFWKVIEIPESRRFQMVVGIWKCLPFGNRHLKMLKFLNSLTFAREIINFWHKFWSSLTACLICTINKSFSAKILEARKIHVRFTKITADFGWPKSLALRISRPTLHSIRKSSQIRIYALLPICHSYTAEITTDKFFSLRKFSFKGVGDSSNSKNLNQMCLACLYS